ncbi:hypothetical protein CSUI_009342, partial [Cystoisospora suis]
VVGASAPLARLNLAVVVLLRHLHTPRPRLLELQKEDERRLSLLLVQLHRNKSLPLNQQLLHSAAAAETAVLVHYYDYCFHHDYWNEPCHDHRYYYHGLLLLLLLLAFPLLLQDYVARIFLLSPPLLPMRGDCHSRRY